MHERMFFIYLHYKWFTTRFRHMDIDDTDTAVCTLMLFRFDEAPTLHISDNHNMVVLFKYHVKQSVHQVYKMIYCYNKD